MASAEIATEYWVAFASPDEDVSLAARHAIAVFYQGLVEGCARKLEVRLPSWVADEDLMSAGQEGLLKAIDRYDPGNGTSFRRFASALIVGSIIDDLRRQDWAPRSLRQSQREITKATRHLSVDGSKPSLSEIADHLGWAEAKVEQVLRKVEQASVIIGLQRHDANDGINDLPEPEDRQSGHAVALVCALFVRDYRQLPAPVQVVLARIYLLNQTPVEVSAAMGLSLPVVRRLHMDGVQAAVASVRGSLLTD